MERKKSKLSEIASLFFKLGLISFGGPAAHIAMMEDEVVEKRKWMSQQHFLDLIGATNIIPGPNSTEMTMHCGYERGGWKGMFVAGLSFIFPAVTMTLILAWAYVQYENLPEVAPFIFGIKPAVIAIILMAAYRLGKKAIKNNTLIVLSLLTLAACFLGLNQIAALFCCGFLGLAIYFIRNKQSTVHSFLPLLIFNSEIATSRVFLIFLKVGAILYGSGYVLFAYLDSELVSRGWLSREALMDAVAAGQFTPGPVLSTATFIGFQMGSFSGAAAATLGIFLPSFLFVLILNPLIPKIRKSKALGAFLDAVNVAAVSLIVFVCIEMFQDTVQDWRAVVVTAVSLTVVFVFKKLNSAFIVLGGAALGYLFLLF